MQAPLRISELTTAPREQDSVRTAPPSATRAERVLVCATQPDEQARLSDEVSRRGLQCQVTDSVSEAQRLLTESEFHVCVVDKADTTSGVRELAATIANENLPTQLICVVPQDSEWGTEIYPSYRCEILDRPLTPSRLGSTLFSCTERASLQIENQRLKRQLHSRNLQDIVGQSSSVIQIRESIRVAAEDDGTVLVRGENGTGTNLVAQGIHRCSKRAWRPFIRIDCSVHSAESLERHLFGDPAATNVNGCEQQGILAAANGGTIFLDNIDTIAIPFQKRLAQLLESQQYHHPQSGERRPLNVRFIAAMHVEPSALIGDGQFREDLLHRLSNITIQTTPLRLRRDDIALLVEHFLNQLAVREGRPVRRMTIDALEVLETYQWPGNVRELQNVIERSCTVGVDPRLTGEDLKPWIGNQDAQSESAAQGITLREMERKLIETTFTRCGGNREKTAQILKIGLRTLSGKLREYGYPPRGGPGSNLKVAAQQQRKAA